MVERAAAGGSSRDESRSEASDSVDEAEVERILQQRKLERQAREELEEQEKKQH